MIKIRKSYERGHADHGWLKTHHSFSFGSYYDPKHMNWRYLRVLNEDVIAAGAGFPMHPHDNMEIFSYVTSGVLEHKDSIGNIAQVKPGRAQLMSAGTGITHSEYNPSKTELTHLFQVWIMPAERNTLPQYQELDFEHESTMGQVKLLADPNGSEGAMKIGQNTRIYSAKLDTNTGLVLPDAEEGWLQILSGSLELANQQLNDGDAAATEMEWNLELKSTTPVELLWFAMD